jgi:hypothetical protein
MINKTLIYFLGLLAITMMSCYQQGEVKDWKGGKVESPGTYHYAKKTLTLDVRIEKGFVKYSLKDSLGNELLSTKDDISKYQRWALFFDEDESLWILSSDIGNAYWKKNEKNQTYTYIRIDHLFDISTIPPKVYAEVKDFF